tara:strand:+ start:2841 stop:3119 length:279 start_codon:yes stop_codon:yes gene_type:complete
MTKPNFTLPYECRYEAFKIKNYSVEVTRKEDEKYLSYQIIYTREADNGKCCHMVETDKSKNTPQYWATEDAKNYASEFIQKYETEYNEFYYI